MPPTPPCNLRLRKHNRKPKVDQALQLLDDMVADGLKPTVVRKRFGGLARVVQRVVHETIRKNKY